ncbi:MAG: aldo/keto reductase [Acidisphaera sp.]|nr:aldo/keto reductase [Acidisphaera sp.]
MDWPETRKRTRRETLALAGGLGIAPFLSAIPAAAQPMAIATRPIPSSGEHLPVIGLGTDQDWRSDTPEYRAALSAILRTLIAGGGSVVDTASNYGGYFLAEPMLGEIFAESGLRPRIFISTKVEEHYWLSLSTVQASLRRLGLSKIDLIQIHSGSYSPVSAGQSLAPLRDWKERGLVRYIGITTDSDRYFDDIEAIMRRWKPDFIELNYSLRDREAEKRLLPAAAELGVATLIDLPFGGHGSHSLFYKVQGKPVPDWARDFDAATWAQFFLKYLLGNGAVTAVIPGTNKVEHMEDNLGAGRGRLPDVAQRQRMAQFFTELP